MEEFDVIIIGSGSAGSSALEAAYAEGARIALIERDAFGGECPNHACIPIKSMLHSAKLYHQAVHDFGAYGIHTGKVRFSFSEIMTRKTDVVETITGKGKRLNKLWESMDVSVYRGEAHFVDEQTVAVGKHRLKAKGFVIATGTHDWIPPIDGIESVPYLTYREATSLKGLPSSIVIVGGGPVGCEFATFFALLGVQVTLIELGERVLAREDEEISLLTQKRLEEYGVKVLTSSKVLSTKTVPGGMCEVTYQVDMGRRKRIKVAKILLAAGKRPNIESLAHEAAGVKTSKGQLRVKETLQTNVKHIFAAGDVSGGMLFTHMAHAEGVLAGQNVMRVLKGKRTLQKRDLRVVPRVTFTYPEVASVGLTPQEAAKGRAAIAIAQFPLGALGRAVTEGKRDGFVKIVIQKKSRKIIGGHCIGAHAGELIHEIALAMEKDLTIDDLSGMIHAFPTWSEGISAAAGMV
jgi:pyruvate/2-oxoglutarate dehydrogenase complex dihydrolipoamide dehydrogenase (E3) component